MWSHLLSKVRTNNPAFPSTPFLQKSPYPDILVVGCPAPSEPMENESAHVCSSFIWNSNYLFLAGDFILIWVGLKKHSLTMLGLSVPHRDTEDHSYLHPVFPGVGCEPWGGVHYCWTFMASHWLVEQTVPMSAGIRCTWKFVLLLYFIHNSLSFLVWFQWN